MFLIPVLTIKTLKNVDLINITHVNELHLQDYSYTNSAACSLQTICIYPRGGIGETGPKGDTGLISVNPTGTIPNKYGATLLNSTLTLQPANATYPGIISTTSQTISGNKIFTNTATFPTGIVVGDTVSLTFMTQYTVTTTTVVQIHQHNSHDYTFTIPNVVVGDTVICSPMSDLETGLIHTCFISASNELTLRHTTCAAGNTNVAVRTWKITLLRLQ